MQENGPALNAFQGEEHKAFVWTGGDSAALLVHGFPGTPAEMRPLAASLHRAGWTVEALLLPGFGAQIATLAERRHTEWTAAVRDAAVALRERFPRVLLIGYSMGAAVAIKAASDFPLLDGLLLIAPFWQLGEPWQQPIWPLLKWLAPNFKPFAKADFNNPRTRADLGNFMPEADLDDPAVQQSLRELRLPMTMLDQLRRAGQEAWRHAPRVETRTMILQGTGDDVVSPRKTGRLRDRFSFPVDYHELPANHHLIREDHDAWPQVERLVLDFADNLRREERSRRT